MMNEEITTEQWEKAKAHFDHVYNAYTELENTPGVNVSFAIAMVFMPLSDRFERGERSRELYEEMLAVE